MSILDAIRGSKVVDSEHGGITQSIGAYQITHNNEKLYTWVIYDISESNYFEECTSYEISVKRQQKSV